MAFDFVGGNGYIRRNSNVPASSGAWTFMCWFNTDGDGAAGGEGIFVIGDSGGTNEIEFYTDAADAAINLSVWNGSSGSENGAALTAGTWMHVAIVANGTGASALQMYSDGATSDSPQTGLSFTVAEMAIGNSYGGTMTNYIDGQIAQARVFDHAMTAAEIQAEMDSPVPIAADCLTDLRMDNGEDWVDYSGNGNWSEVGTDTISWISGPPVSSPWATGKAISFSSIPSAYTTNLTDIYAGAGSTTGWSALGGGASGLNAETDYFIQGTGMTSKNAFASTRKGMILNHGTDRASAVGTDGAILMWCTHATPNSLATMANGGLTFLVGSGTSAYKHYYVGGSDTIEFMGWVLAAVNPSETTDEADQGSPTAVEDHFGMLFDLPTGGPTKGAPNAIDAIRVGRCDLIYTGGAGPSADTSFDGAVADKGDVTDRLGLVQEINGSFFLSGLHQLGSSGTPTVFTDSSKTLFWRDHPGVTAPFNTLEIINSSSVIKMTSLVWKALGTKTPGTWTTTDNATVTLTNCSFIDWGTFTFLSNTRVNTCTFLGTGLVTIGEADVSGSTFNAPTVAADEGAVYDNRTTSGTTALTELSNTTFVKGVNAHHAIRFGTNVTHDLTLTGVEFTGFDSSDDASGSTLRFDATSGSLTLTLISCTVDGVAASSSNIGVDDAAGITVTISTDIVGTFTGMQDNSEVRVYEAGTKTELAGIENATAGSAGNRSFAATIPGGTAVDYTIVNNQYEIVRRENFTWPTGAQDIPITQRFDRNYSNP